jgi:hypothetical protein
MRPGRTRKNAPVTLANLPPRAGLDAEDRVRLAKLSLALHSDLLGLQRGSNGYSPRYGVGDATPERMQHARQEGSRLVREEECFEDGRPTGLSRKRFVSRLELLKNNGALDPVEHAAGEKFLAHVARAAMAGGAKIVNYSPRWIDEDGMPELQPAEAALYHARMVANAYKAIHPMLRPVLAWMERSVLFGEDYRDTAEKYWENLSPRGRESNFRVLIQLVCAQLAGHFVLDRQHRWAKLQISRTAQELLKIITLDISTGRVAA